MSNLLENEAFASGVAVGIGLYQQKVVMAHERREPLVISNDLFYLENGKERLGRILNEICK